MRVLLTGTSRRAFHMWIHLRQTGTSVGLALVMAAAVQAGAASAPDSTAVPPVSTSKPTASAVPSRKPPVAREGWQFSQSANLEFIYDDNFLRYSDEDLDVFLAGSDLARFRVRTYDDLILAPGFDVEARLRSAALIDTRFRLVFKHWQYVVNPIKTNTSFSWYIRQALGGSRSLELSYAYAPEQYIRQLTDRLPYVPSDTPLAYEGFKYTRNAFTATYRATLPAKLAGRFWLRRTLRYYNRPFQENDIKSWEARGSLGRSLSRQVRLTADYAYEDGGGKGYDQVGEALESSDDSDGSYEKDFYQLELAWQPRSLSKYFDRATVTGQYTAYYFTSTKSLFDDPYHVGRKDEVYQIELALTRRLARQLEAEIGARYAQRVTSTPWPGVLVSEDKDYDARRYWLGLTYTP